MRKPMRHYIGTREKGMIRRLTKERSIPIYFEGMKHAPENELGVVFLLSKVAKRLNFLEIDVIQPHFPDCWAYQRTKPNVVNRTWIEFEFKSHSFKSNLKRLRDLRLRKGFVVCWEHDWKGCEKYAKVIELRSELCLGRQIWIQNTLPEYQSGIDKTRHRRKKGWEWTVSGKARPGDLLLMYRAGTIYEARKYGVEEDLLQSIANIFVVKSFPKPDKRWKFMAEVAQVALLQNPLYLDKMRSDRILQSAPFVLKQLVGRNNVTPYWYRLYDLILELNPYRDVRKALQDFRPELI
jgi:hypothetical protein